MSGGLGNIANFYAVVAGDDGNTAGIDYAAVGGGFANNASGIGAFVGGGGTDGTNVFGNLASGAASVIGGGLENSTSSAYATVPGGARNLAGGLYSFAAGQNAHALHQGSFVWADSQNALFSSTANDQFSIRAQGGVRVDDSTSMFFGSNPRQMIELYRDGATDASSTFIYGIGVQTATFYMRTGTNGGFAWYQGGSYNSSQNNPGGGKVMMTLSTSALTVNGTFVSASDRNLKENFQAVSTQEVLGKVAALPITRWNYKEDTASEHLGPMAQDFYAAFKVGPDDKHITTIDESGVALAAIQGLNEKLNEKDGEIQELKKRLEKLEQMLETKAGGAK